jgi:hypothetical protein
MSTFECKKITQTKYQNSTCICNIIIVKKNLKKYLYYNDDDNK